MPYRRGVFFWLRRLGPRDKCHAVLRSLVRQADNCPPVPEPFLGQIDCSQTTFLAVCGLVRIHAYKNSGFQLFDVPTREAAALRKKLLAEGYVISHSECI